MPEPVITFRDVSFKYYGTDFYAIEGINLEIKRGEFVGILGPAGQERPRCCTL
jgi:ABC-type bacteriocin/lantibiotic exporter with double-glycine peptidase domain